MRDPLLEISGKIIGFYEREFYCFSNFSSFVVVWQGRRWQTSEHAYQAAHFFDCAPELVEEIFNAYSAHEAKKIVERNRDKVSAEFYNNNIAVMEDICLHKLQQNPYVKKKLLQTGDKQIVEDSPVDDFWGWGPNRDGRNELGKIWMRLRKNIS